MENKESININDIAQNLNISPTTVSRALSGKGRVSKDTKDKINNYLKKNDVEPHTRNSKFIDKKTKTIGVVLPAEGNYAEMPFFTKMLMSLYDFFNVHGYNTLLIRISQEDISTLKDVIKKHNVDGVILTRIINDESEIKFLKEKKVPFVVIGTCEDKNIYQVDADQRAACRELTNILFKMGIRKTVLMCANRGQKIIQERIDGYLDAIRDNEMPIEYKNIIENAADENILEKALFDILRMQAECIICSDDGICISMLNYFQKMGVRVPKDIRVATFYNSPMLEEHNSSITSIEFDIKEWAKQAGGMLLKVLNNEECERKQIVGYHMLLKESTKFSFEE